MTDAPRVRFLTPEWASALQETAAASAVLAEATRGVRLSIEQVVTGGPDGDVRYVLEFDDGTLRVRWADDATGDVTFRQSHDTAVALSRGTMNAQLAFMLGKLRVSGDLARLMQVRDAFLELDDVFAALRERTDYP